MTWETTFGLPQETPGWHLEAECRDENADLFFAQHHQLWAAPRAICERCPVFEACLAAAIEEDAIRPDLPRQGMRGGLTPAQRAQVASQPELLSPGWTPYSFTMPAVLREIEAGKSARQAAAHNGIETEAVTESLPRAA